MREKLPENIIITGEGKEAKEEAQRQKLFNNKESDFYLHEIRGKEHLIDKIRHSEALIDIANEETSKLMKDAGIKSYNVPYENFYILGEEFYEKYSKTTEAATIKNSEAIIFKLERFINNPLHFGVVAFHELLHLKSYSLFKTESGPYREGVSTYRQGVSIINQAKDSQPYHSFFRGLHEAIVSKAEKEYSKKLLNDIPGFSSEKEWLNSESGEKIKKIIEKEHRISKDDIYWIKESEEIKSLIKDTRNKHDEIASWIGRDNYSSIAYKEHRKVLNYICEEISEEFSNEYQNPNTVYDLFLKANFNGNLLEIGRLVEKTFGKRSFRVLGGMSDYEDSAYKCWLALRKNRIDFKENHLK
jgi:hypothetical protein